MRWILLALCVLPLATTSCRSGDGDAARAARDPGYVECVVPRPEICSQEHRPVCGLRDTGVRCVTTPCATWERKTYTNACVACADGAVYGWQPDACVEEGPVERNG